MRRVFVCAVSAMLLAGGLSTVPAATKAKEGDVSLYGPAFSVANLTFTLPAKWSSTPVSSTARAGQWIVPTVHGEENTGSGEIVLFYFGPGIGGSAKDNIAGWLASVTPMPGKPAPDEKHYVVAGHNVSRIVSYGTYNEPVPIPGVPPLPHPHYALAGVVVETSQGNLYWRFTGPESLVTANLALFDKVIESLK